MARLAGRILPTRFHGPRSARRWHTACVDLRRLFGPGGAIALKNQRCFLCSGLIEAWEDATWLPSLGIHVHTRCYEREMGVEKDRGARER